MYVCVCNDIVYKLCLPGDCTPATDENDASIIQVICPDCIATTSGNTFRNPIFFDRDCIAPKSKSAS